MVTQASYLGGLKEKGQEQVLESLKFTREKLVSPNNLRIIMATDVTKLSNPLEPWNNFISKPR